MTDALLYVISDRSSMSWSAFRGVYDYLDAQQLRSYPEPFTQLRYRRRHTVRALDALAHAEFDFGGDGTVSAAPSVLARLPRPGLPQAVLTGARSPDAVAQLKAIAQDFNRRVSLTVRQHEGSLPLTPSRVVVQSESVELMSAVATGLGLHFEANPPAWTIPQVVTSLDAYLASRNWSQTRELNWDRMDFDPWRLRFDFVGEVGDELRLSRYREASRGTTAFVLWQDGSGALVEPEWGRYAVLKNLNQSVLLYDDQRFTLAVPAGAPLPRLLSRALALCSGDAPQFVPADRVRGSRPEHWAFELYRSVPPQIAEEVAVRLDQHFKRCAVACPIRGGTK